MPDRELRHFAHCVKLSFKSIVIVSRKEKSAKNRCENGIRRRTKKEERKNRSSAVTIRCPRLQRKHNYKKC